VDVLESFWDEEGEAHVGEVLWSYAGGLHII